MYMTCKHYLERVLGWKRSKLGILGKRDLKLEFFLLNWRAFAWASAKRALSKRAQVILNTVCLSELQASSKRTWQVVLDTVRSSDGWPEATGTWSLKRTILRLSEQHPVQPLLIFRFVHLGTNPNFLNCFFWLSYSLFIHLILLEHHLKSNWTCF